MMLTKRQFALAVGASAKWVDNASRTLRRRFLRTDANARWLGLVHEISRTLDISLRRAADLATQALDLGPTSAPIAIANIQDGAVWVMIDIKRYHSRFGVALAAALLDAARQPGPPPPSFPRGVRTRPAILVGAAACGVDVGRLRSFAFAPPSHRVAALGEGVRTLLCDLARACIPHVVIGDVAAVARGASRAQALLDVCCAPEVKVSQRVAGLLIDWDAGPRGISRDNPFIPDEQTVVESPVLALDTRFGPIILRRAVEEDFRTLVDNSDLLDLGGVATRVLQVRGLVEALRAGRQRIAATAIPELEAAAVVLKRID